MFRNENAWNAAIAVAAAGAGVPVWLVKATIGKESSFNPAAFRDEAGIQDASRGLGQLLASTARWLGYDGPAGDDATHTGGLYDPETSIRYTAHYLGYLARRYPGETWDAIYAAYNSGKVRRAADGTLTNSKGVSLEPVLIPWRRIADYFHPAGKAWRDEKVPFGPHSKSPAQVDSPPRGSDGSPRS